MFSAFLKLNDHFKNGNIKILNQKLNNLILNYSFLCLSEPLDVDNNLPLFQNIRESKVAIINQYKRSEQNPDDLFFIICFKHTLLILNPKSTPFLQSLFSKNHDLTIYFLPNTKNLFNQYFELQNANYEAEEIFLEEISNFNKNLNINHTYSSMIQTWKVIRSCISGYLIKQSLFNLKKDKFNDFFKNNQNNLFSLFFCWTM